METLVRRQLSYLVGIWCVTALAHVSAQEAGARVTPELAEKLRATLEQRRALDPTADLQSLSSRSSQQLIRMLDEEIAKLTSVEANPLE